MHLESYLFIIPFALALVALPLTGNFEMVTSGGREMQLILKRTPKVRDVEAHYKTLTIYVLKPN